MKDKLEDAEVEGAGPLKKAVKMQAPAVTKVAVALFSADIARRRSIINSGASRQ